MRLSPRRATEQVHQTPREGRAEQAGQAAPGGMAKPGARRRSSRRILGLLVPLLFLVPLAAVLLVQTGVHVVRGASVPVAAAQPGTPTPAGDGTGTGGAAGQPSDQASSRPVNTSLRLHLPDALIELPPWTDPDVAATRLASVAHVEATTPLQSGPISLAGKRVGAWAVDPEIFRSFTPQPTAGTDGLWDAVARGELAITYALRAVTSAGLGTYVSVTPDGSAPPQPVRLGAIAEFALPPAVVVSRGRAAELGLNQAAVLVSAPGVDRGALAGAAVQAFGPNTRVTLLRQTVRPVYRVPASGSSVPRVSSPPLTLLQLYKDAAGTCPGLPWEVLAAIGQLESDHGRNAGRSPAGAEGPMQFLPSTWKTYGIDADGNGVADINDQVDAVYSAARYLCANGAGSGTQQLQKAIFAYNHVDWYVRFVMELADRYRAAE
jgi:hypothetical protein